MRKEPPLVECAFGWGRVFRLYQNYLDVNGTYYALSDLAYILPIYQRVLGISSMRLELGFGQKKVILRGIAAIKDAQRVIEYLNSQYLGHSVSAKSWSKESETGLQSEAGLENQLTFQDYDLLSTQELSLQERAQAPTAKVETPYWQHFRQHQRQSSQRRLPIERSLRKHGFDAEKLAQRLKEGTMPEIAVPLRLLPGEKAHYSTEATLCGEPMVGATRYTYPAKDHGKLILTNKRLVYIGRKSQIVLDYARLLHISRLRGAIAVQAEHWYRREIFEVRRCLECTMYLDCILERCQQGQQLQATSSRYLNYNERLDEAAAKTDVNTMPLAMHDWNMADMLDTMDRW